MALAFDTPIEEPLNREQEMLRDFYSRTYYQGKHGPEVLTAIILDTLSRRIFRTKYFSWLVTLQSTLLIVVLCVIVSGIAEYFVEGPPLQLSPVVIALCFLGPFSLFAVKAAHILGFVPISKNLPQILLSQEETTSIYNWSVKVFSVRRQFLFSLAWGVICFFLSIFFFTPAVLHGQSPIVFGIANLLAQFCTGQLIYWAIHYPGLWQQIGSSRLKLNWLNPSTTPELRDIAGVANVYVFIGSLAVTAYFIWLFFIMKPFEAGSAALVSLALAVGIIGALAYIFFAPHGSLARAIRYHKGQTIREIEWMLTRLRKDEWVKKEHLDEMKELLELQSKVVATPGTMIEIGNLRDFFLSLLPPIGSYLIGFIDLKSLSDIIGIKL
jgi:hypothetical protein